MAARLADLGCPRERLHVVRLPFAPPAVLDYVRRPRVAYAACFGGRFVAKKGVDVALRAFARAFPGGGERMLLVGTGDTSRCGWCRRHERVVDAAPQRAHADHRRPGTR
jgi:hypothetical protein